MNSFKDLRGREWRIEIHMATKAAVKDATGFDLSLLTEVNQTAIGLLADDPCLLYGILKAMLKSQLEEADVSEEELGRSMHEDECENAIKALVLAGIAYGPKKRRDALRQAFMEAWNSAKAQETAAFNKLEEALANGEFSKAVDEALEKHHQQA